MKALLGVAISCRLGATSVPDELRVAVPMSGAAFRSGTATGATREDATLDRPTERTVLQQALTGEDIRICIFNRETGKTLKCEPAIQ